MTFLRRFLPLAAMVAVSALCAHVHSFSMVTGSSRIKSQHLTLLRLAKKGEQDLDLKAELTEYLAKRQELRADDEAKA